MSDKLIIGFDLCDTYTQIAIYDEDKKEVENVKLTDDLEEIPTTICKVRRRDEWKIGAAACEMALFGSGIAVDKLLRLVKKGGYSTLEGTTYQASDLLELYIREAFEYVTAKYSKDIDKVVFTVKELDCVLVNCIVESAVKAGVDKDSVMVISHTESFLYYLLRQPAENLANYSVLFDLSSEGLSYYECQIQRGVSPQIAQAKVTELEEGFSLDILESEPGKKLADNIFSACVDRQFSGKIISNVYMTGRGLLGIQEWGSKSLKTICNRRRVFLDNAMFAKGAVWAAKMAEGSEPVVPYVMICDGRIWASVSINMVVAGAPKTLTLISAGQRWYDTKSHTEFILDDADSIDINITPAGVKKSTLKRITLGEFPERPNKTTRVGMDLEFTSETELLVTLKDMGFGELFASSGVVLRREISL
ncbi:MAG: hypothetical protein K6F92_01665 [Lachnospiraceae bacterium]|nr:hypothetical protein [Lachnospiraceae bacterium]